MEENGRPGIVTLQCVANGVDGQFICASVPFPAEGSCLSAVLYLFWNVADPMSSYKRTGSIELMAVVGTEKRSCSRISFPLVFGHNSFSIQLARCSLSS